MATACSECGADAVVFAVPEAVREHVPDGTALASVCRVCLTVDPLEDGTVEEPLTAVSDELSDDESIAGAVVVLVGLLESLALNRRHIQAVVEHLEAEGADPLSALERLAADTTLRPAVDLAGRTHQLEQLLE